MDGALAARGIMCDELDVALAIAQLLACRDADLFLNEVEAADCLVFLVGHSEFSQLEAADLWPMFNRGSRVVIDVKSIFARKNLPAAGFLYWSL